MPSYAVGDVFRWDNFSVQRDDISKTRYFIFLGQTSLFESPANWYGVSATTQVHYYEPGGSRNGNNYLKINGGDFGFPSTSIIDVDQWFESYFMETLQQSAQNIVVIGKVSEEILIKIFSFINDSKRIAPRIKLDVYDCYCKIGIDNVPKPRNVRKPKY